jgi:hypothetical protein
MKIRRISYPLCCLFGALLPEVAHAGNAVSGRNRLWPGQEIRILLCAPKSQDRNCGDTSAERKRNALSSAERLAARQALRSWSAKFAGHIVFQQSDRLRGMGVVIQAPRRPSRCSTRWAGFRPHQPVSRVLVGGNCNAANFARTSEGSILHELMHVAGVYHEQQRSDRSRFIQVSGRAGNLRQWSRICITGGCADRDREAKPSGPYDFSSIMHYSLPVPSDDRRVTLTRLGRERLHLQGMIPRQIGQRMRLSSGDVETIKRLYPRARSSQHNL